MSTEELVSKLNDMHIDQIRMLSVMSQTLLKSGETGVLLWLGQRKERTYSVDIVNHFGLTPGRVANIIKKLEHNGYIEREQDAEDLRKAHIALTDKGIASAAEQYRQMNEAHTRLIRELGEEDTIQWMRILDRIIAIMDSADTPAKH